MFPDWVRTLDDAERFLRDWVIQLGGDTTPLGGPTFVDVPARDCDAARVQVWPVEVRLASGAVLSVRAVLRQDREQVAVETYAFNLRYAGRLLWRYCRNDYIRDLALAEPLQ